jgi:hypothetical protein
VPLRVGILIIGSLLWREDRQQWRDSRLDMNASQRVTARIRYGRKSQSWGDTYTMVLSRSCGAGCARVVPCSRGIAASEELVAEAEHLWRAEQPGVPNGRIGANWGCVGLLCNPERQSPDDLLREWAARAAREPGYERLTQALDQGALMNMAGLLQIAWPRLVDGKEGVGLDLLLATATKPTLEGTPPSYASVQTIADAWNVAGQHARYFWNNSDNGITTFQDDEIRALLHPRDQVGI